MAWLEPISAAVTAADLAMKLAQSSGFIRKNAARLIYSLRHGSLCLPIFGCGGAGKSTAARILGGEDALEVTAPYEESWRVEPVKLTGDIPGKILAAPGQIEKAERHWPELFHEIMNGRNVGIINVVSYGYHSLNIEKFEEHDLYRQGMTVAHFSEVYTRFRRELEIEFLKNLLNGLSALREPIWIITLVNKQDLWWKARKEVRAHYESGEYNSVIRDFRSSLGERNFQHEFVPASLTISNLATGSGQILAESSAGYGLPNHIDGLNLFLNQITQMFKL